ncbi:single tm domain protein [Entamoeba histolytica]|uniref:Single tm domain protein n=1 Tax=Entamoeba histolytica TaxID=5759 RepID=A0A175K061_ENTHI|nr:single tm domain protein [Entamoeba histolytica]
MSSSKDKQTKSKIALIGGAVVTAVVAVGASTGAAVASLTDHANCTDRPFGSGATDFSWMSENSSDY